MNQNKVLVTKTYIYVLALAATAILFIGIRLMPFTFSWLAVGGTCVLLLLNVLAARFPVSFSKGSIEIVDIATLLALIVFGPIYALVVSVPSLIYKDKLRLLFVSSSETLMIFAAGLFFQIFSSPLIAAGAFNTDFVYAVLFCSAVYYVLDMLINTLLMKFKYDESILDNFRELFIPKIPSDILAIFAAVGTAYVMVAFGPAAALVLFLGGVGALISLNLIHTRQRENEALKAENADLLSANVRFAASLVEALAAKAPHVGRVAAASSVYAGDVGEEFGFDREQVDRVRLSALLQDIGLATAPDAVLRAAPERLNPEGQRELERHPVVGEEILSSVAGFEEAAKWVRWHHERLDGSGYPDALQGRWLPLEARILAAAETYASLVLDSPGRPALSGEEARFQMTSEVDKGLDAEVIKALLRILDREGEDYAAASGGRFAFAAPAQSRAIERVSLRVVGE